MDTNDVQTALGHIKGVRHILEQVVKADAVLRASLTAYAQIGDLRRDVEAESAKLEEAQRAVQDTQAILDRAKQAVAGEQVKLTNLAQAFKDTEAAHEKAKADLLAAVERGAADYQAKLDLRLRAIEADYQARAGALQGEIDALVNKRDALAGEIKELLSRLGA